MFFNIVKSNIFEENFKQQIANYNLISRIYRLSV